MTCQIKTVLICVPGDPVGKGRPRITTVGGFARTYTPAKTKSYEDSIRAEGKLAMRGHELLAGPVKLSLEIYMPIPVSYTKAKKAAARLGSLVPTKKPDLDNVLKAVCDAFNGIVWVDDTQVVDCHVSKRFAETACVIAIVTPLDLQSV
jgi:Holliday junction resolvase RusA-like endonuclease